MLIKFNKKCLNKNILNNLLRYLLVLIFYFKKLIQDSEDSNLKIFKARPLLAFSDDVVRFPTENEIPNGAVWRLRYEADNNMEADVKNEILTSDDILEKDRFEIDLLKVKILIFKKIFLETRKICRKDKRATFY